MLSWKQFNNFIVFIILFFSLESAVGQFNCPSKNNIEEAVQKIEKALVRITVTGSIGGVEIQPRIGTGFLIKSTGVIVTASHTFSGQWDSAPGYNQPLRNIRIETFDRGRFTVFVENADLLEEIPRRDIAILSIVGYEHPIVEFTDSVFQAGETAHILGFSSLEQSKPEYTFGLVDPSSSNQIRRPITIIGAQAKKGFSGSPIFDCNGKVRSLLVQGTSNSKINVVDYKYLKNIVDVYVETKPSVNPSGTLQSLKQEIERLQKQLDLINQRIDALGKQVVIETRSEEKFRIRFLITEAETERDQIYEELDILKNVFTRITSISSATSSISSPTTTDEVEYKYYTVQPRDTLRSIAKKFYNDPNKTELILEANKNRGISNTIKIGQKLKIPILNY